MMRTCCVALVFVASVLLISAQQPAPRTVKGLTAAPGLEVTLWASEPDLTNPTNIAIDERGRVWVLEAVNYRRLLRNQPDIRPAGDRIVILEDTNGDGKADKTKVFDQNPELRSPLGIAVLGDRVIVSQAPDVVVYTKDADDRIVNKDVLLTGFKGVDHDHGVHAIVFGPDGRYYFNTGNAGFDVTDRSGTRFRSANDQGDSGPREYSGGRYVEGAAMVMNPDGTRLQVLAHNFRNPYELAVDAFGNIWQTDNDDDGNAWTRANYVMEGGNYGFRGPHGRSWREDYSTHFHNELPGVVPNMIRLGPGSPCGLIVYEGTLLPEKYRGHLLHAEAGRRVIASYPLAPDGAGFSTRIDDVVYGGADTWFRPSDIAVAPDGSVFIADWYDPAVGGHNMGDTAGDRGRIYRLAPPNHKSRARAPHAVPLPDLESPDGLVDAFRSPAQAVFYLAHTKLRGQGQAAVRQLQAMLTRNDPVLRARALWLLGQLGAAGTAAVEDALRDSDPRFRILGLRIQRSSGIEPLTLAKRFLRDPSTQVRREIALMLQDAGRLTPPYLVGAQSTPPADLLDALTELAKQYDGKDRWYLEALGIAARGREDALYVKLREVYPSWNATLGHLLWELRAPASLPYLTEVARNESVGIEHRLQALDALAGMESPEATRLVESLIVTDGTPQVLVNAAFARYKHQLFSLWSDSRKSASLAGVMKKAFAAPALHVMAVELANALGDWKFAPDLMALAASSSADEAVRAAAVDAVGVIRNADHLTDLQRLSKSGPVSVRVAAVRTIGLVSKGDVEGQMQAILLSDAPNAVRSEALRALARTAKGIGLIIDLEKGGKFPPELRNLATMLFSTSARGGFFRPPSRAGRPGAQGGMDAAAAAKMEALMAARERAAKVFPPAISVKLPTAREMEQNFRPSAAAGRKVYESETARCSACHSLGGAAKIGPDLSTIASKLDKQALLDAIVMPSAAIAFGYESWVIETKSQGMVSGLLTENTAQRVTVKTDATEQVRLKPSEIVSRRQSRFSMMPEGLINALTQRQIVDLLEFLATLKPQPVTAQRP
jgi:putative membrane-bound dehydrogenase-like protein